ncbi:MAG: hypothetical protein WCD43_16905 [Candidatus Acidiferrales bacterium]
MKSLAPQLENLARRVRETSRFAQPGVVIEGVTAPTSRDMKPKKKSFPPRDVFLVKTFPYTKGEPDPQNTLHTAGTAQGAYFNIEEFGDPLRGRLSVGVSAGVTKDADWSGKAFYSELPERWIFGDAISSSASVTQVSALPAGLAVGSYIHGDVGFSWDPMYPATPEDSENLLYNAISLTPGTSDSALGGFVGVSAMAELTITLLSDGGAVSSGKATQNLLTVGADAQFYGNGVQDKIAAPFLFLDFAFAGNPWAILDLQASVPYVDGAKQVIVETSVNLVGARGGVNDPNGGWVTAAFMDLYEGASPVSYIPFAPNPFLIRGITAFSAAF